MTRVRISLCRYEQERATVYQSLTKRKVVERLRAKDPSLWSSDPKIQITITKRLGWLTVVQWMRQRVHELSDLVKDVHERGITHVVLLGMGGSSLCPEVCRNICGVAEGFPELLVLDSTDPATIQHVESSVSLNTTLFIVASKSGTTIEVQSLYRYFHARVQQVDPKDVGSHFLAITDPETPLVTLAGEEGFFRLFVNPADIGGRYSALSYFGLVPAALIGIDVSQFLERADAMVQASAVSVPIEENSAALFGALLGQFGKQGRDKVTFLMSPELKPFGVWVEQLVAESTGKKGTGLVPIDGEDVGAPTIYGEDRFFVVMKLASPRNREFEASIEAIERVGHPIITIDWQERLDLAGEFFRWEVAMAVAGAWLGVNPFDEPNVTESKQNTQKVLADYQQTGAMAGPMVAIEEQGVQLLGLEDGQAGMRLHEVIWSFLQQARPGDYVALMAYLQPTPTIERAFGCIRTILRDRLRVATTLGYGPRFLHSTGQLHKGGAHTGVFIQVTADDVADIAIPGADYTFGTLKRAQALGDLHALTNRRLRTLSIHLRQPSDESLQRLVRMIEG